MAVLKCERHPQMQVNTPAGTVRFVDGVAEATDEQADAVADVAEEYGIELADEPDEDPPGGGEGSGSGPEDIKPPARSASKAEWAEYARSQAKDSDEVNEINLLTKEQLIEQYGGGDAA
ncbi:hypothetical protein [Streptomyces albicerus]|uniref:hypothetical protein n=1 Tax=Streptomyces albicerus TaxID=2569859 RepID=UPI00124AE682|nr:hypothetical protein [Streptomyces albicerus]